jgi:hypothetical protein
MGKVELSFDRIKSAGANRSEKTKVTLPLQIGSHSSSVLIQFETIQTDTPDAINQINRRATIEPTGRNSREPPQNEPGESGQNDSLSSLHDVVLTSEIADIESVEAMLDSAIVGSRSSSVTSNSFSAALVRQFDQT